jgi:single-strand DNA-binding protein
MNQLNSILLEGNLVRDPVFKETPRGTPLCTFAVASNRYYRQGSENEQEVSFFDVETWSKLAQDCGERLKKGRGVRVVGRLKQDRWTGADGKNYTKVKIVAEHVELKHEVDKKDKGPDADDQGAEERSLVDQVAEGAVF